MNIIITSAGQRVSLVRSFQKELKKIIKDGEVFTTDMQPQLSAACNISDKYFAVKRVTDEGYIDQLIALCHQHNVKMIVPTIDTELAILAAYKNEFKQQGISVIISSQSFINTCRDKRKTNAFFELNDIKTPKAIHKHNPVFPLFIKPYDGSLSIDTYTINSAKDLHEHHLNNEKFLFMEYISKKEFDEYTIDMYYDRSHHVQCIVPRKRLLVRAGEINKGLTCKNSIIPFLKQRLGFIEGAVGCLTMQVFMSKTTNAIKAIEINPRFGGGYPLSYCAGANYPLWLIQEYFFNKKLEYYQNWEDNLLMLRYDDEVIVHANKN